MNRLLELQLEDADKFANTPPDLGAYAQEYPEVADILRTCTVGTLNTHPNPFGQVVGKVYSWNLVQEPLNPEYAKGPTLGRMPVGIFKFPTENKEKITMLEGRGLDAVVGGQDTGQFIFSRGDQLNIPANSRFNMIVWIKPTLYLCEYLK